LHRKKYKNISKSLAAILKYTRNVAGNREKQCE